AGAAAREMLRSAAAQAWGVDASECRAERGAIVHAGGRRAEYGSLVERAARLPVPEDPPLKSRSDFTLVGTPVHRLDQRDKVVGETVFGTDVDLPGMLVATVALPPAFGAQVRGYDDARARRVPGVVDVVQIPDGVAVLARNTWAALKGRDALSVDWAPSPLAGMSSVSLFQRCADLAERDGNVARRAGDARSALSGAARTLEAVYRLPFLDHATMEPMNCTARVAGGKVEVWAPTQVATAAQQEAARVAGVKPQDVTLHVTMVGGGFGRRLQTDYVTFAVEIAKRVDAPVQLFWTREDTTRHGFYRPLTYHHLRGGLDGAGSPVAWHHRIVGPPTTGLTVAGAENPPYALPNFLLDYHLDDWGVPVGAWRSVGNTHNGFVIESFIDELAAAAGVDPYEYRRQLMDAAPRLRGALDLAAARAGWGEALGPGRGRGIAAVSSFGSHVAEVADVTVAPDGTVRIDRVVCAVDCGQVINPDIMAANMEGAVTLAAGYTLKHGITLEDGGVREGNFTDYPILRIDEMPAVEVYAVDSPEPPGGIGEPGVPPLAPAVTNAIFAATGTRIRTLPVPTDLLKQ
ncbi:MAG TPA: molybdopterin cofactor-binding domain-containing protein, partial [Longimicrobiales bacterium]|nr:molybdopterin cofactor-binding domain-containing protein [Longimicrobiales bacterium]